MTARLSSSSSAAAAPQAAGAKALASRDDRDSTNRRKQTEEATWSHIRKCVFHDDSDDEGGRPGEASSSPNPKRQRLTEHLDTQTAETPAATSAVHRTHYGLAMNAKETDPKRLAWRRKEIRYGKNTLGYDRYATLVPKHARKRGDPQTPDVTQSMSKRQFAGLVKAWRRKLHEWDPPRDKNAKGGDDDNTLANPLTARGNKKNGGDTKAASDTDEKKEPPAKTTTTTTANGGAIATDDDDGFGPSLFDDLAAPSETLPENAAIETDARDETPAQNDDVDSDDDLL